MIYPVLLVEGAAHHLGSADDQEVVLQQPGDLGVDVAEVAGGPGRLQVEDPVEPLLLVFLLDPGHHQSHGVDLPPGEEEADDRQRGQPSVHLFDRLVVVGEDQVEADRFPLVLGEVDQLGDDQGLELFGHRRDLGLGDRDETPVLRPGRVVDLPHQLQLVVKIVHPDVPDGEPLFLQDRRDLLQPGVHLFRHRDPVGQEVLGLGQGAGSHQVVVIGEGVGHHQPGRGVVALEEEAAGPVGRGVERADHLLQPSAPQPLFGGLEEGPGRLRIVEALEETEVPGPLPVVLDVIPVGDRRDPADRFAVAEGEEERPFGVFPEGVAAGGEGLFLLPEQGRDPVGVFPIDRPGEG